MGFIREFFELARWTAFDTTSIFDAAFIQEF
jgi:hypothetical protein